MRSEVLGADGGDESEGGDEDHQEGAKAAIESFGENSSPGD